MSISKEKRRITFTLSPDNVDWLAAWLKRNHAPKVLMSQMIEEYLQGVRYIIEELEMTKDQLTIGDLFRITGDALDRLKEPTPL
jgi:hypothetical protein